MPRPQPKTSKTTCPGSSLSNDLLNALHNLPEQFGQLQEAHQAYETLEMLIAPCGAQDRDVLEVSRSQLATLMRALNRGMRQEIDAMEVFEMHTRNARAERHQQRLDQATPKSM